MKKILFIIFSLILVSCETDVDAELPYNEQVVISSVLYSNFPLSAVPAGAGSFVHIGRTIPALDEPDTNNALIKNADVKIISDIEEYQLEYDSIGYWVNEDFLPEVGKNYRIEVNYKNKITYAETFIPIVEYEKSEIYRKVIKDSYDWEDSYSIFYYVDIMFKNKAYPVMTSEIFNSHNYFIKNSNLTLHSNFKPNEYKQLQIYNDYEQDTTQSQTQFIVGFDFFDPAIKTYYDTMYQGDGEFGIFGGGGTNRKGNIKNGIGFFYGSNFIIDTLNYE